MRQRTTNAPRREVLRHITSCPPWFTALVFTALVLVVPGMRAAADLTQEEFERRCRNYTQASECYDRTTARVFHGIGWISDKLGKRVNGMLGPVLNTIGKYLMENPNDWRCFCERMRYSGYINIDGVPYISFVEKMVCRLGHTANRYISFNRRPCMHPLQGEPSLYFDIFSDGSQGECQ